MNQLFNEFLLLEREVASGGQTMDVELGRQVDILFSPCLPYAQIKLVSCAHLAGDQSKGVLAEVGVLGEESHELVGARLKQREPEQPREEDPHLARHKPEPGEMLFPNLLQLSDQVVTVGVVGRQGECHVWSCRSPCRLSV